MSFTMARIKKTGEYKKLLSDKSLFAVPDLSDVEEYQTDRKLDDGQLYVLRDFSQKPYFPKNILHSSVSIDSFEGKISDIDYLISVCDNIYLFQNATRSQEIKKRILSFGDSVSLNENPKLLIVKDSPDAIYNTENNELYFKDLINIKTMFNGIEELYKTATDDETKQFLSNSFINLKNGFSFNKVKIANRQRIAIATEELNRLGNKTDDLFAYINDYMPDLNFNEGKFNIGDEKDLKNLLYGIEQRFFTTPLSNEKMIAKSTILIGKH